MSKYVCMYKRLRSRSRSKEYVSSVKLPKCFPKKQLEGVICSLKKSPFRIEFLDSVCLECIKSFNFLTF